MRIDFGGGWTDTPPYSVERGGCVLNAALTLRGAHPVTAEAGFLDGHPFRLVLESRDIGARHEPRLAGDVLNYANPADPFALLKAALVVRGVVPLGADPGQPVALSHRARAELDERLMLVYTGQQRLAKNLLQRMAARWMARDTETTWMLGEIARLAVAMRDALAGGDLDSFGWLIAEHWTVNRRMDPGCANPFIDELFEVMRPYLSGAKLAGAGGGGFAIALAKDGQAAHDLENELARRYAGTPVGVWPCGIPEAGLVAGR